MLTRRRLRQIEAILGVVLCLALLCNDGLALAAATGREAMQGVPVNPWTARANLATARYGLGAAVGADGRVYALGGFNPAVGGDLASVEAYDATANTWSTVAPMPTARLGLGVAAGADGRIYAIGGARGASPDYLGTAEVYDPRANTWATLASMPTPRAFLALATGVDGRIYALGGQTSNGPVATVEVYDPSANAWAALPSLRAARADLAATIGADHRIYAVGGSGSDGQPTGTVEAYDPVAATWAAVASMGAPRQGLAAVNGSDSRIYALGGDAGTGSAVSTVEALTPGGPGWTTSSRLPTARSGVAAAHTSDGHVYAIGGIAGGTPLGVVESESIATTPPPSASLTSLTEGLRITEPTIIVGSVGSPTLTSWSLSYRAVGDTTRTQFASGTTPVVNATLGTLDPTLLLNGIYEIDLSATDSSGQTTTNGVNVVVAGQQKIGNFTLSFNDLTVPVAGIPMQVIRTYDSRDKGTHDFGFGWTLSLKSVNVQASGVIGDSFEGVVQGADTGFPTYCIQARKPVMVTVTFPDGRVGQFQPTVDPQCQSLVPQLAVSLGFQAAPGTTGSLTALVSSELKVVGGFPGPIQLLDPSSQSVGPADPEEFQLTTIDGEVLTIGRSVGLEKISARDGSTLTIGVNGMTHSKGVSIPFTRDSQGRIVSITDPDGHSISYTYGPNGDLIDVKDRMARNTQFTYDNAHYLQEVIDPRGVTGIRTQYDAQGRVVAETDANGHTTQVAHDLTGRTETITDRMGNTSTLQYDAQGNVTSRTDPLGNTTTSTYDANGNKLSQSDPLGHTTTFAYDANNNLLKMTNALGNAATFSYDANNELIATTDPLGQTTKYEYDAVGHQTAVVSPRGSRRQLGYDANGVVTSYTSPTGATATFTRDAVGRLTGYTDPLGRSGTVSVRSDGQVSLDQFTLGAKTVSNSYQYDAAGALTGMTNASGGTSSLAYDAAGQPSSSTNTLGDHQSIAYDNLGSASSFTDVDGRLTQLTYDAEGHVSSATLPGGQTLTQTRDPDGRVTQVSQPAAIAFSAAYDAAGRVVSETRRGAGPITLAYDAANRLTGMSTADNATNRYAYDAAGRLTGATDALGNQTQMAYDLDGNLTRVTQPDGANETAMFDLAGRLTTVTDERGSTLQFTYDSAGQQTAAVDTAGGKTTFGYDEMGSLIQAQTPAGSVWQFGYDAMGDRASTTYPWGGTMTRTIDVNGRRTGQTDPTGASTSFVFDAAGRPTQRTLSDGAVQQRTYTPSGKPLSVTSSSGTTSYTYDSSDRLIQVTSPDGSSLTYTHDSSGRLAIVATGSGTTQFGYDNVGRLVTVTDSQAGTTTYAYDLDGRVVGSVLPDGSHTAYTRDSRGRVTDAKTLAADGVTVLRDEKRAYDPAGNPLQITEAGRQVSYGFDQAGRVTAETRSGVDAGTASYAYDADWNLIQKGSNALTYDGTMRLMSDGIWTNYSFDAGGRPVSRSRANVTQQLSYDSLGRLRRVVQSNATPAQVDLEYGGQDLLSRIVVDGVGRRLVWDVASSVPLILEERADDGSLLRRYVHGLGPVAVVDGTGVHALHVDQLGSVRMITSKNGAVVSRYAYAAYGDQTLGQNDTTSSLRFAGEYLIPELGLYYLRARFYDPNAGRFLTPDPLDPAPTEPTTFNPYRYAADNPTRFTDPTGMFDSIEINLSSAIMEVLATVMVAHWPLPIVLIGRAIASAFLPNKVLPTITAVDVLWKGEEGVGVTSEAGFLFAFQYGTAGAALSVALEVGFGISLGGYLPGEPVAHWSLWRGLTLGTGDLPETPEVQHLQAFIVFAGTFAKLLARGAVKDEWARDTGALKVEFGHGTELSAYFNHAHAEDEIGPGVRAGFAKAFVIFERKPDPPTVREKAFSIEIGLAIPLIQFFLGGGRPHVQLGPLADDPQEQAIASPE